MVGMSRAGKTARGRATRARVISAATGLFLERGYLDTTMAAIAEAAGLSVQGLYVAFGSKVGILNAARDVAVVGDDDEDQRLLARPWVDTVKEEPDGLRALRIIVDNATAVVERTSPIRGVIEAAAADSDVADLLANMRQERLAFWQQLAGELTGKRGFNRRISYERAADILYTVISTEVHRLLVLERGWPEKEWRAFAYDTAAFSLFGNGEPVASAKSR